MFIYFIGLIASLAIDPFYGVLTYFYEYYTHRSWAESAYPPLRWSFIIAAVIMVSYFIHWEKVRNRSFSDPSLKYLLILLLNMAILTPFAISVELSYDRLIFFLKLVGLYYFVSRVIRDRKKYNQFVWFQVWGNFLFGWHAFRKGGITAGRLENIGGVDTVGSNYLANHMIMILPFIGNMFFFGNKWVRIGALIAAPFIINALILCNSRGAFLAMIVMVVSFLFLSRVIKIRGFRTKIIIGVVLGSILLVWLANPQFWERMSTIRSHDEDKSAMGRIASWKAATRMIKDHPFGSGGDGWELSSPKYIPEIVGYHEGQLRSVHNTYLMMATDWGIQGLILYSLFFLTAFTKLHRIRKRKMSKDDLFFKSESLAIETALIGFLVAALFGNRIYAEGVLWFCSLATALDNIQLRELEEDKNTVQKVIS
jgi:probable O-glycosylation ligase (exosortase A-associated)